jgi:hypothetical protein
MRTYNRWHLEIKWWLQGEGIWDWVIEHRYHITGVSLVTAFVISYFGGI